MTDIITQNTPNREEWLLQLSNVITSPLELLQLLGLGNNKRLLQGIDAKGLFPLRVPRALVKKIKPNDPDDPLLRQIITLPEEFILTPGYSIDPLDEQQSALPGLLHKYHNRVLLLVKTACAINCRYCFRRHFPYQENQGNKKNWRAALDYIQQHTELDEVIFSGGDPMMAHDHELDWLITQLEQIPHIKRLRIHSRLVSVIPARVTQTLCQHLSKSTLQIILVTHINHANEIDHDVRQAMLKLKNSHVTLLNQSVLLKGVNDDAQVLAALSRSLFEAGILPYYLHLLDKVQGAAHFLVEDQQAQQIMQQLTQMTSGYLVPKLVRETGGEKSKTLVNIN